LVIKLVPHVPKPRLMPPPTIFAPDQYLPQVVSFLAPATYRSRHFRFFIAMRCYALSCLITPQHLCQLNASKPVAGELFPFRSAGDRCGGTVGVLLRGADGRRIHMFGAPRSGPDI